MTTVNATIASPRLLLVGGGTVRQLAEILGKFGLSRPLVVSDPIMVSGQSEQAEPMFADFTLETNSVLNLGKNKVACCVKL